MTCLLCNFTQRSNRSTCVAENLPPSLLVSQVESHGVQWSDMCALVTCGAVCRPLQQPLLPFGEFWQSPLPWLLILQLS